MTKNASTPEQADSVETSPGSTADVLIERVRVAFVGGARVWAVITIMVLVAVGTTAIAWGFSPPAGHLKISIWMLIPAFAFVESFPIHVQFRSESSSFSLFEIPLVLGVLLADASALLPAVAVGSTFALWAVRRQPLAKLLFNGANQLIQAATTVLLFHLLSVGDDPLTPVGSIAVLAAAVAASAIGVSAIAAVIVASERRIEARKTLNTLSFGVIVACTNVSLALIAAVMIDREPWAAGLLVIPLAVVYGSYRAFVSERTQREQVEFLYTSTKSLQTTDERQIGISTLVVEVATMFRAARVELLFFGPADSDEGPIRYSVDGEGAVSVRQLDELDASTAAVASSMDEAVLVSSRTGGVMRDFLDEYQIDDAMVSVLRSESRVFGLLVAGDRVGSVADFNDEDLRLFETLCFHAATALENDRLGQALVQLRTLERELSHQATHDALTGLPNRVLLGRHLDRIVSEGRGELDLLFIDLDDFKLVNDTLGHASGDQLLIEVAERITTCLRVTDLAARLGGDEFAIALDHGGHGGLLAQRIIDEIAKPIDLDGVAVRISCSIGIATSVGPTATEQLLRQADVAMYAAKNNGKGQLARYTEELGDELASQGELQQALVEALEAGEFTVNYQPVYDLATRRMIGAEALVRWNATDGQRLPGSFLSVAEESGLVVHIDRFVLATVLEDLATIRKVSADSIWIAVNLSPRHLQEEDVVDHITATVLEAGIESSNIVLEITETGVMRDTEANVTKLETLNRLGFRIALDDFGTGFSSINHLRRFPVSLLKIAQPFIDDLGEGGIDTFVRAIIELGHTLGLPVVAEGIEERSQMLQLNSLGCDMGQGFLLARPMPFAEFRSELAKVSTETREASRHS